VASIYRVATLEVSPEVAGDYLERFAYARAHVFSMATGERMEGDARIVTQADGSEIVELNVTVDPVRRRVAYTVPGLNGAEHHHAEMRVDVDADGSARLSWTIDYLPHHLAEEREELYDGLFAELLAAVNSHG
jgi:hypothetical protein